MARQCSGQIFNVQFRLRAEHAHPFAVLVPASLQADRHKMFGAQHPGECVLIGCFARLGEGLLQQPPIA